MQARPLGHREPLLPLWDATGEGEGECPRVVLHGTGGSRYSRPDASPADSGFSSLPPVAAWTAPTTTPAAPATALVTVSATDIALSPKVWAPSFTCSMTCAAFSRAWAAFCRACPGAALARFTRSLDVFLTDVAARPAAAVARPMALLAFFTGPGAAAFDRPAVAVLAGD